MLKSDLEKSFYALKDYLNNFDLKKNCNDTRLLALLKSSHKRYYALLVWHSNLDRESIGNHLSKQEQDDFYNYFKEVISDLCQGILLFSQGLYKPSYLITRSGLENFFRCIGLFEKKQVLSITSVYELIDEVRDTKLIQATRIALENFDDLHRFYKDLCSFTHTADINHMSLTSALSSFPRFESTHAVRLEQTIRNLIVCICSITSIMFHEKLKAMHYRNRDVILDILPQDVKQLIAELNQ